MFHVLVLQMAMSFGGGASEMHTTPWGTPRWACIMVAPAYASDTSGLDFQQFVDDVGRNRDFFISVATAAKSTFTFGQLVDAVKSADEAKRSADEAKRSAVEAFKASPEGKIQ